MYSTDKASLAPLDGGTEVLSIMTKPDRHLEEKGRKKGVFLRTLGVVGGGEKKGHKGRRIYMAGIG